MRQWEHKQISEKLARFYHRNVWGARDIPDLGRVVSLGRNGIRVWDRDTGRCLSWRAPCTKLGMKSLKNIRVFSVSPNGDFVFLFDQAIWRLPLESLEAKPCIADVPEDYHRLQLADDGDTVGAYTVIFGEGYHVYSLSTGETINSSKTQIDSMEFSPDSKLLLWEYTQTWQSGSDTLRFMVVRLSDGECLLAEERTTWDRTVYFSNDGSAVLYGEYGDYARNTYPLKNKNKKREPEKIGVLGPDSIPPFHLSFKPVKAQFGRWQTGDQP